MAHKTRGTKTNYPSDVSDEEWAFCAPYLTLMKEEAPQRDYTLRAMFNAVRYMVRAGCPWRMIPNDLPPWYSVQQQAQRWIKAGCFEAMGHDLRKVLRLLVEKPEEPSAVIIDGRTLRSTPESGRRAGYDGHKRQKGSKVQAAVDSLGHLLALKVTAANEQERAPRRCIVGQGAGGHRREGSSRLCRSRLHRGRTRRPSGPGGSSPHCRQTQRSQARFYPLAAALGGGTLLCWATRFRRLVKDYERLPTSLAGLHWLAFLTLMLNILFHQSA